MRSEDIKKIAKVLMGESKMKSTELKITKENVTELMDQIIEGLESDDLISDIDLMKANLIKLEIEKVFEKFDKMEDHIAQGLFNIAFMGGKNEG